MKKIQKTNVLDMVTGDQLYEFSSDLILSFRRLVYQTANFTMVETYWRIGENLLKSVSTRLRAEFGQGFSYVNLTNMRKFYQQFSNVYALRKELSWTHYRSLLRVENPKAREVYMNEAADNGWSTRFLDEQVDKHYYERLIATHKEAVNELNEKNATQLPVNPQDYILKDPLLYLLHLLILVGIYVMLAGTDCMAVLGVLPKCMCNCDFAVLPIFDPRKTGVRANVPYPNDRPLLPVQLGQSALRTESSRAMTHRHIRAVAIGLGQLLEFFPVIAASSSRIGGSIRFRR